MTTFSPVLAERSPRSCSMVLPSYLSRVDVDLVEQHDVAQPLLDLALDDPRADVLGLVGGLLLEDAGLGVTHVGRDLVLGDPARLRRGGEVQRDVPGEGDEVVVLGHEVGVAVDLDEHADLAVGVDVALDGALGGLAVGELAELVAHLDPEDLGGLVDVAPASSRARLQSIMPGAGLLAQGGDVLGADLGSCAHAFCSWVAFSVSGVGAGSRERARSAWAPGPRRRRARRRLGRLRGSGGSAGAAARRGGRLGGSVRRRGSGLGAAAAGPGVRGRAAGAGAGRRPGPRRLGLRRRRGLGGRARIRRPRPGLGGLLRGALGLGGGLRGGLRLGVAARLLLGLAARALLGLAPDALLLLGALGGEGQAPVAGGLADRVGHHGAGLDRVVVAGDHEVDAVGVAVGVDQADDRDAQALGLAHRDGLGLEVDDEHRVGRALHVLHAAQVGAQLGEVGLGGHALARRQQPELALGLVALEVVQAADALVDGLEVRQQAAEPAVVDVGHAGGLGDVLDGVASLLLGAHEQHDAAALGQLAGELARLLEQALRLQQIDDVDAAALAVDEAAHLGVPAAGLC